MANTVSNVTAGKPKVSGSIYRAPIGSTIPTDASTALAQAFVGLGYVSEDGITNSNSPESDELKAWGGDTVLTLQTAKPDTFKLTLIESKNAEVLKTVYGDANVTGDLTTGLTVTANANDLDEYIYVVEMVLRGDVLKRIVIPDGKVSEIGDIVYQDGVAVGYELKITALPDTNGNTHYEYLLEQ